jgi:hypothetical protein
VLLCLEWYSCMALLAFANYTINLSLVFLCSESSF